MSDRHEVLHCDVCGCQAVVNGESDKKGCPFCGAPAEELWFEDETNEQPE